MVKVVHICHDEKFIDCAISVFASLKNVESIFFVFTNSKDKKLIYTKSHNIITFNSYKKLLFATNNHDSHVVMIHSLFLPYNIALKINKPIIWSSWGYDIYNDIDDPLTKIFSIPLYKPQTRVLLKKIHLLNFKRMLVFFLWKLLLLRRKRQKEYFQIVEKTSYFSTVLPIEFENLKKKFPKAQYCPFHYFSDPHLNKNPLEQKQFFSNRILLGNSNDPTNNHYDILKKLNSLNIPLEIIIPFSYPNNEISYNNHLIKKAASFKNLKIEFIKNFIEQTEYFKLINSCSIAFFGHLRQQAVGNIIYCLKTGKKVFFYEDSILFSHFSKQGYTIFSIDNDLNTEHINKPLSKETQNKNREIFFKEWDYEKQHNDLQFFFNNLNIKP